jgi:hypothetical protein
MWGIESVKANKKKCSSHTLKMETAGKSNTFVHMYESTSFLDA